LVASEILEGLLVLLRGPLRQEGGFQILQLKGFLLQPQGGGQVDGRENVASSAAAASSGPNTSAGRSSPRASG
jgi:hypothetical protein